MTTAQQRRLLTDEQAEHILLSHESITALARHHGVSRQIVSQVRNGSTYTHVRPDLPRGVAIKRCTGCIHAHRVEVETPIGRDGRLRMAWRYRCSLGFPEITEEGLQFAAECSAYAE